MSATPERIAKLPGWAREHIADLERERRTAQDTLASYLDGQTPSKCWTDDHVSVDGTSKSVKTYFNASERIVIECAGVRLDVGFHRDDEIFLSYSEAGHWMGGDEVALIPSGHQQFRLVSKANMR